MKKITWNFVNRKLYSLIAYSYYSEFNCPNMREKSRKEFESLSNEDKLLAREILRQATKSSELYNAGIDAYTDSMVLANYWLE